MLPARLALCDLEAPGWGGASVSALAFVAAWLTDCCMAFSYHNNGLRSVEAERVSSKLFFIGLLVLPTRSPKAILTTKELMSAAGALETARYPKKQLKVVKGILKSPKKRRNVVNRVSRSTNNNAKASRSDKRTLPQILKRKQNDRESDPINDPDPNGLPKTLSLHDEGPKLGVISMFDGVGSVYHIITKKIGRAPTVYIAAETDPVLRRLVAAELGIREDQQWGILPKEPLHYM